MQILGLLSDILLLGATASIALWCRLLAKRLRAFDDIDTGLGGSIAALSRQVAALEASVGNATRDTGRSTAGVDAAVGRADDRIGRLEMLLTNLEILEEEAASRLLRDRPSADPDCGPEDFGPSFRASRGHIPGQTRNT